MSSRPKPPVAAESLRGFVEARGPEFITGWAWRPGGDGPLTLVFKLGRRLLGESIASDHRADLQATGVGDGRAGFAWRLIDPSLDPADIRVFDKASGMELPNAGNVTFGLPKRFRGTVEARGPEFISGWASAWGEPLRIAFLLGGRQIGGALADRPRQEFRAIGIKDGRAGFAWRLPFSDPPIDPASVEVIAEASREQIPDAGGLQPIMPKPVRGVVEQRAPEVISGWAQGPDGPVTLQVLRGKEVVGEVLADGFREDLAKDGVGDGRATFEWPLPPGDPTFKSSALRVVDPKWGVELADAPGLQAVDRPVVCGAVEESSYRLVTGWAWDGRPGERVMLDIVCDGVVVAEVVANERRRDLAASGLDDGRHVFHWEPPRYLETFDASKVQVIARPSGVILPSAPRKPHPTGLEVAEMRIEGSWLYASLRPTGERAAPTSVDVICDSRFVLKVELPAKASARTGCFEVEAELPRRIGDAHPHVFTLHDGREGDPIPGLGNGFVYENPLNSLIELVTPLEIRGWVIDPQDRRGHGFVELYDGDRWLRTVGFGRPRPEVARDMGATHAWEFAIRRLPLSLFDGEEHQLRLICDGHALSPHLSPRIRAHWTMDQSAPDEERFHGAVTEINAQGVKGWVFDRLSDSPVELEVLVDGEVAHRLLANAYRAELNSGVGHGFYGFDWRMPARLMNGGKHRVAVRLAGRKLLLPPRTRSIDFPLTAFDEASPPDLAPPAYRPPARAEPDTEAAPGLISLIVLNLDGAFVLEPFLRSLAETRFRDPIEIILIDHGSRDETRDIVEAYRGRLPLTPIYRGVNHSFSASCNLGAALARGAHLVMVNNDIEFTSDCLAGMRDLLESSDDVGLVGLRLLEPRYCGEGRWEQVVHHTGVRFEAPTPQNKSEPRMYHPYEAVDGGDGGAVVEPAATAALAMVRKADFRALHGFDEGYRYGYEDIDFALRLRARLGKRTVSSLSDSAVHNRSATRESKLIDAPAGSAPAPGAGAGAANLDRFIRRFSRHLPRLILRQLIAGGEAWRAQPLRITFVVGDPDRGHDTDAARALGRQLRARFGWEPMLLGEDGHDLGVSDVLVSLRPGYELRRAVNAAPGLITVAWAWDGPAAWDGRDGLYQLRWSLPGEAADAAVAARDALAGLLAGARRRIAIKAQAENEPRAHALAEALEAIGQHVRIDGPKHWDCGLAAGDELVVAMAGVRAYAPFAGAVNVLCLTPGAEPPDDATLADFDRVFAPGDPQADAIALVEMHDRLRREHLGALAD